MGSVSMYSKQTAVIFFGLIGEAEPWCLFLRQSGWGKLMWHYCFYWFRYYFVMGNCFLLLGFVMGGTEYVSLKLIFMAVFIVDWSSYYETMVAKCGGVLSRDFPYTTSRNGIFCRHLGTFLHRQIDLPKIILMDSR